MFRVTSRKFGITSFHGASLLIITAFLLTLVKWTVAFNIDLATVLIHHASSNTHFGFSVSLHRTQGKSWLLIGSPTAKTTQPTVTKGGAVYKCGVDKSNNCHQITFDISGSGEIITENKREHTENKSHQWFGATVYSAGENGPVVACAPRYVYFSNSLRRRDPVGTCWTARSSLSGFKEYSPCRTSAWGYHRQGSCQAGLSAVISKNGRWLYIGAVGSWYWQGQVFSQDLLAKQYLYSTSEAPQSEDDSYLGYSAAVGEFTGDGELDLAVGMPRGHELNGKVLLFTTILKSIQNLTGEQLGAYFGYALCVADVNGDRLDDVIVGAPLHSDFTAKSRSYEEGRVYIFFQTAEHQMRNRSYLDGVYAKGRFGMALSSLGDIDRDGYQDFAVGAPYAGEKERGIVYIFHGSRNGMKSTKPSQIIRAEDIGDPGLSTFGFSLSGGMDMDENHYPDLLVGAYESNRAIFFRSRPVVNLFVNLMIDPNSINLDEQICSLSDGTGVSCVVVSVCLRYNGTGVPSELHVLFKTRLDIGLEQSPRVFFLDREKINHSYYQVSLRKGSVFCKSVYAYIQEQVRDKLTPIIIEVATELRDLEPSRKILKPILNETLPRILMKQVNIQKNCGKDNMCIPDLTVEVKANMDEYLIGSRKKLELTVNITNHGEDAFEAMLYLETPQDFNYVNINKTSASMTISCFPYLHTPEVNNIVCDIGNPFPAGHELIFSVILKPAKMASRIPHFHFKMKVNR
ncbi:integrin alpha-PS2-like [Limulus polyphemus]|uniref:Integrin alpha-PS2-like n=1 Tax=Limulus polyphemus TaxID=6850 RepID=A0ABM1BLI5_LIMPO|nr:integrin alpha-PS2-like [Limulus polyphemus]